MRKTGDWAEKYGWSIPVFLMGILFGLSITVLVDGSLRLFEVVAAWGTLSAAFAAFWSVNFSRRVQRQRDEQEDKLRQPRLRATKVWSGELFTMHFQLVNLGSEMVFVSYIGRDTIPPAGGGREQLNLMLKSGESQVVTMTSGGGWAIPEDKTQLGNLCYCFLFYSGSLGPMLYTLSLPYSIREEDGLMVFDYGNQRIDIEKHQQRSIPGLAMPSEELKAFHKQMNEFSKQ